MAGACLLPLVVAAQMQVTFGPRGEIAELRMGDVVYLTDAAVVLSKPGWSGTLAGQRTVSPASVQVSTAAGATVYGMDLPVTGGVLRLRETVRIAPDQVRIDYELTPGLDVAAEAVYVQCMLPASIHAGVTRYAMAGATVAQGLLPATVNPDSHVIVGSGLVDWAAFAAPGGGALRIVPTDLTVQLQDNRRWDLPCFGLLATCPGGRLQAGKTIRFGLTYSATTAATLAAEARALARGDVSGLRLTDDRALAIGKVALDRTTAEVFSGIELSAEIAATYTNPFDPREIDVGAEVTGPDGQRVSVPGFYYVPMRLEARLAAERLRLAGPPSFRVRYTPTVPGAHRLVLKVTDRSGTLESAPLEFEASAGSRPGFVRVAKGSPLYFADDRGQPFFAVGENVCWSWNSLPLTNYAAWLKGLGAAGGNWARLFLSNGEKGQEWLPAPTAKPGMGTYLGLGRYALDNAWRLDEVVRLASENGVRLMFCLGTFGEFTTGGYFNVGIDWQTSDRRWDPKGTGLSLHNGAWAALMAGAAGTTMLWYWDDYVHPNDLYHLLTPVRRFADTVDWATTRFEPLTDVTTERTDSAPETFADLTIPAEQGWGATPASEYTVGRDGSVQGGPVAMTLGSPTRGNPGELHTKLVWRVDLPRTCKVVAHLGQVCRRARLQVTVDGAVVLDRELLAGEPGTGPWKSAKYLAQYDVWVSDYDEDIAIDMPAGQHTVAFANAAGDWLQIPRITLPAHRSSCYSDVNLVGLRSDRLLLLWVHHRESTWRTEFDGKQPRELAGLRLRMPMAQDGAWQVQHWDTFAGTVVREETVRAADGELALTLPELARDVAWRLAKAE
jgi:hypothetical protein